MRTVLQRRPPAADHLPSCWGAGPPVGGRTLKRATGNGLGWTATHTSAGRLRSPPVCITLNSRSGRPRPMNERVHLSKVVSRFPKSVREGEVDEGSYDPAGEATQTQAVEVDHGLKPPNGGGGAQVPILEWPYGLEGEDGVGGRPRATSATPGRLSSAIMSPTTNTSGWPGRVKSVGRRCGRLGLARRPSPWPARRQGATLPLRPPTRWCRCPAGWWHRRRR